MRLSALTRAFGAASVAFATFFPLPTVAQSSSNNDNNNNDNSHGQSTFVTKDNLLAFAITAPDSAGRGLYFSLRVHTSRAWGAVGLGKEDMPGSLIFLLHLNAAGDNVTFSPRTARGRYEPEHFAALEYDLLDGTGVDEGGYMTLNARCRDHCRSWPGGAVDAFDPDQKAIYALGALGAPVRDDDPDAPLGIHRDVGVFHIDLRRTNDVAGEEVATRLDDDSVTRGAVLVRSGRGGNRHLQSTFHAIFMIFAFLGLLPAGIVLIHIGGWVRWHIFIQVVAFVFVVVGVGLGVSTSLLYQRARNFRDPHQIIGLFVFGVFLIQLGLGFTHHTRFKKNAGVPTKLALPHMILGHFIVTLGISSAFLGFPFALKGQYMYVLLGLTILVTTVVFGLMFFKKWLQRRANRGQPTSSQQQQPWRAQAGANVAPRAGWGSTETPTHSPPRAFGYQPTGQSSPQIRLSDMSSQTSLGGGGPTNDDLGPAHTPKAML
ncbi:CBD9-like protein [Sodiomyces alkalinus F11]|uniref:CBD9-like protein n=1 Tax=Sodiomyces alkalinus (strain CBS 110278 / VKM F-3762 / F11) TaxID=1314773 RepID=A0A3N2Q3B9_SODAK|nr:CBD9-like protein [Sodiomyces alkalinus F11]ROT41216.1 CBD9-like protein [Sodiomyces alkalinus F11]